MILPTFISYDYSRSWRVDASVVSITGVGQRDVNATWWTDVLLETLKSGSSTRELARALVW